MIDINRVTLHGRVVRDPEVRMTETGQHLARFDIATNSKWKDKVTGESKEEVEYHKCVAWGPLGEAIPAWIAKGSPVFIEGRIKTKSWVDGDTSAKRYNTEIHVDRFAALATTPVKERHE